MVFDGVCDQTTKLQTLYYSMPNDLKWIISSSGHYMFVKFINPGLDLVHAIYDSHVLEYDINPFSLSSKGFSANIHYGK